MPDIISAEALADHYLALKIDASDIAAEAAPGHHIMVRFDGGDPVAHAITDIDRDAGTITFVTRTRSNGNEAATPEAIDVEGPIGSPPRLDPAGKVVFIAEGLGVAAILPRLRHYRDQGCYTIVIAGFTSRESVYWLDRLDELSDELYVTTDDGSFGVKGPIRHVLRSICQHVADIERAFIIGSVDTMKANSTVTRTFDIPTRVALGAALEGQLAGEPGWETSGATFDWSEVTDLNGHQVDYDGLMQMLGNQATK